MVMNSFQEPTELTDLLERESGGEYWVLTAILEREIAIDALIERNQSEGVGKREADPLMDAYQDKASIVESRKVSTGVLEPQPRDLS